MAHIQNLVPDCPPYHAIQYTSALNRIGGLAGDQVTLPALPGRIFLSLELYTSEGDKSKEKVLTNATMLMQCAHHFGEFFPGDYPDAPAHMGDSDYSSELWNVILDELNYQIPDLTADGLQRVYLVFLDARFNFKGDEPKNDDRAELLLSLIDQQLYTEHARKPVPSDPTRFGPRDNTNFALRMASRVLQWRHLLEKPDMLLSQKISVERDILSFDKWDDDAKKLARNFATRFKKPAPVFPIESPNSKKIRKLEGKVDLLKTTMDKIQRSMDKLLLNMRSDGDEMIDTAKEVRQHLRKLEAGKEKSNTSMKQVTQRAEKLEQEYAAASSQEEAGVFDNRLKRQRRNAV